MGASLALCDSAAGPKEPVTEEVAAARPFAAAAAAADTEGI